MDLPASFVVYGDGRIRRNGRHADSALPSGDDDRAEIHRAKRRVHQRVAHHNRAGHGGCRAERAGGWLRGANHPRAAKAGQGAHAEQRAHRAHPPQPDGNELDELHGAGAAGVPSADSAGAVHHAHLRYADRAANHPCRHFPGGFARVDADFADRAGHSKCLLSGRNARCGGGRGALRQPRSGGFHALWHVAGHSAAVGVRKSSAADAGDAVLSADSRVHDRRSAAADG